MTALSKFDDHGMERPHADVLLYSDNATAREKVRFAVGSKVQGRVVNWTEVATHAAVTTALDDNTYDLVILDGEANKVGGMAIARQMRHELYEVPPILLLVGRVGDAWLATWSEADAAVAHPLDPFDVKAAVDGFFTPIDAPSA